MTMYIVLKDKWTWTVIINTMFTRLGYNKCSFLANLYDNENKIFFFKYIYFFFFGWGGGGYLIYR